MKQVIDEACNNARNCKITTMPSLKYVKIVSDKGQCEELTLNPKPCFVKPKWMKLQIQPQERECNMIKKVTNK